MRINKYIASSSSHSRRVADTLIAAGRVTINGQVATTGSIVAENDDVRLDGRRLTPPTNLQTIMLHKPVGYIVSRDGQGGQTIYDLLPPILHHLKPIGRLDKDSSGLLLLTNNGQLAQQLTHPSFGKIKQYEIRLGQPLQPLHRQMISDHGLQLTDGPSKLQLERLRDGDETGWQVTMREGRNRQIRRTFAALGYDVIRLHRTHFGTYQLGTLAEGTYTEVAG